MTTRKPGSERSEAGYTYDSSVNPILRRFSDQPELFDIGAEPDTKLIRIRTIAASLRRS
jgi:hypothetical protein